MIHGGGDSAASIYTRQTKKKCVHPAAEALSVKVNSSYAIDLAIVTTAGSVSLSLSAAPQLRFAATETTVGCKTTRDTFRSGE